MTDRRLGRLHQRRRKIRYDLGLLARRKQHQRSKMRARIEGLQDHATLNIAGGRNRIDEATAGAGQHVCADHRGIGGFQHDLGG